MICAAGHSLCHQPQCLRRHRRQSQGHSACTYCRSDRKLPACEVRTPKVQLNLPCCPVGPARYLDSGGPLLGFRGLGTATAAHSPAWVGKVRTEAPGGCPKASALVSLPSRLHLAPATCVSKPAGRSHAVHRRPPSCPAVQWSVCVRDPASTLLRAAADSLPCDGSPRSAKTRPSISFIGAALYAIAKSQSQHHSNFLIVHSILISQRQISIPYSSGSLLVSAPALDRMVDNHTGSHAG